MLRAHDSSFERVKNCFVFEISETRYDTQPEKASKGQKFENDFPKPCDPIA